MPGVWRQQQAELVEGMGIVFSSAAHVAAPCRKIRHRDQLIAQPREIGDIQPVHLARLAFCTGHGFVRGVMFHGRQLSGKVGTIRSRSLHSQQLAVKVS